MILVNDPAELFVFLLFLTIWAQTLSRWRSKTVPRGFPKSSTHCSSTSAGLSYIKAASCGSQNRWHERHRYGHVNSSAAASIYLRTDVWPDEKSHEFYIDSVNPHGTIQQQARNNTNNYHPTRSSHAKPSFPGVRPWMTRRSHGYNLKLNTETLKVWYKNTMHDNDNDKRGDN